MILQVAVAGTAVVVAAAVACCSLAVVAARRLVLPRPRPTIIVVAYDAESVIVPATPQTLHPGIFGIWAHDDNCHLVVGDILDHDRHAHAVRRRVVHPPARPLYAGESIIWTSHVFAGPEALSSSFENVDLRTSEHVLPAWLIPAPRASTRWAIHIHGIRTTRITALRSVPAAQQAGMTSLVVSFRGDGEADGAPAGASMLGATEWQDLEPAVRYAADHGATHVVLIAWSMGAQVALNYVRRGVSRQFVTGLVLVAPITDWKLALANALRRAHLPAFIARLATQLFASPHLYKVTGAIMPIDLNELDWTRTFLTVPTLVVHSRNDTQAPIQASRQLARANPDVITFVEPTGPDHALEYNTDTDRFTSTISSWLGETFHWHLPD